ncbi:MAG: glycosyltransferase family 2 protein [Proteobacteria bacterium]|nr:glycosyltransferase family 2 protein [Pseudomonadota bacterium]
MIDIIIVTYNAKNKLRQCLKSLFQRTNKSSYKLTVVDNHSTDGSYSLLKTYNDKLTIIRTSENKGFSFAANLALKSTSNKLIALLDDDVVVTKGWLQGLTKIINTKRKVGIVTPKLVYPDGSMYSYGFLPKTLLQTMNGEWDSGKDSNIKECDACPGPCWLMKRSVIDEVGYFDERYFPSQYEDTDYCLRVRQYGYKIIYDGTTEIIHHHLSRTDNRVQKNRRLFYQKWEKVMDAYFLKTHMRPKALSINEWKSIPNNKELKK